MAATIDILERIKETCEMAGAAEKCDRALSELEAYPEAEVAAGETSLTKEPRGSAGEVANV